MRYVGLIVGIALIVIGLLAEVGSILSFAGSFGCEGDGCVFGPLPFLLGGGVVLIVLGFFVVSIAASALAMRGAAGTVERWSRLARMNRFGSFGGRGSSRISSFGSHGDTGSLTSWHVSSSGDHQIPNDLAPMIDGILSGLRAGGLIPPDAGSVTVIDSVTGLPVPASGPSDGRTEAERARDLRATGTLGRVTVHAFRELPAAAPGGQLFELQLEVAPEALPPYRVRHFALVPARWRHRLTTGAGFPAWVDAQDPSRLLIEWERD